MLTSVGATSVPILLTVKSSIARERLLPAGGIACLLHNAVRQQYENRIWQNILVCPKVGCLCFRLLENTRHLLPSHYQIKTVVLGENEFNGSRTENYNAKDKEQIAAIASYRQHERLIDRMPETDEQWMSISKAGLYYDVII